MSVHGKFLTNPQQGTIAAAVFFLAAGYALFGSCAEFPYIAAGYDSVYGVNLTAIVVVQFLSTLGMIACCVSSNHNATIHAPYNIVQFCFVQFFLPV